MLMRVGLGVACLGLLLAPHSAAASTVAVTDGEMKVAATDAGINVIDVAPDGLAFRIHDSIGPLTAGDGCTALPPHEAVCAGMIMVIRVDGSDGDDFLGLWDVKVPVIARGGGGDDLIETGGASDEIDSGAGFDTVEGGDGADALTGGTGTDRIDGGRGGDALDGEGGEDVLRGGGGEDDISGGAGNDLADGGAGDDQLSGDEGDNTIIATRGNDTVTTGTRADTVYSRQRNLSRVRCRFTKRGQRGDCSRTRARIIIGRPPTAWPPRSKSSGSVRARAAQADVTVLARWPSNASRLSITVDTTQTHRVRVCVRLFNSNESFIGRFPRRVWTRKDSIKSPRLRAHYATGKLRKKGCQRRFN